MGVDPTSLTPVAYSISASDQTENRLKKLIRIWRALHEYVNFVHDPEKQCRSLSEWSATGVIVLYIIYHLIPRTTAAAAAARVSAPAAAREDSTLVAAAAAATVSLLAHPLHPPVRHAPLHAQPLEAFVAAAAAAAVLGLGLRVAAAAVIR